MALGQQVLVTDKKYQGKYVAFKSFTDNAVIAFGDDPSNVLDKAHKKGEKNPVIVFISQEDTAYIY